MLRFVLALLIACAGLPAGLSGFGWQDAKHAGCCCCVDEAGQDGPTLAADPCGCGCIYPGSDREPLPEAPRDRHGAEKPATHRVSVETVLVPPRVTPAARLHASTVPLRAPPPRAALGVWQE